MSDKNNNSPKGNGHGSSCKCPACLAKQKEEASNKGQGKQAEEHKGHKKTPGCCG